MKILRSGFNSRAFNARVLFALASCARLCVPASARSQDQASIVVAFVTDTAGKPLEGAEVDIVGTSLKGNTDNLGRVALLQVPTGKALLRMRRLGYAELRVPIAVTAGQLSEMTYELKPLPTDLEKVVVRESALVPARYAGTTRFDGFYRRRATGNGTFLTREMIDDRHAEKSEDLLKMVTGIRITYRGSTPLVNFARCNQVNVFIDGIRSHDGFRDFNSLSPLEIEAIEVYKGLAEVPPEFSPRPNDCAAIVVWTRWHGKGAGD